MEGSGTKAWQGSTDSQGITDGHGIMDMFEEANGLFSEEENRAFYSQYDESDSDENIEIGDGDNLRAVSSLDGDGESLTDDRRFESMERNGSNIHCTDESDSLIRKEEDPEIVCCLQLCRPKAHNWGRNGSAKGTLTQRSTCEYGSFEINTPSLKYTNVGHGRKGCIERYVDERHQHGLTPSNGKQDCIDRHTFYQYAEYTLQQYDQGTTNDGPDSRFRYRH